MASELGTVRLYIDADARFAAAAGGAARYFADAAGMENKAIAQLQEAIEVACQEAFESLTEPHHHLLLTFTTLPDRLEIAVTHEGHAAPALGLDAIAGFAAQMGGGASRQAAMAGVDRVQFESKDGVAVTRFTKYIGQNAPR